MTMIHSPLTSEQIDILAEMLDAGQAVPAQLSASDVGAVMAGVIRRRERRRVAALLAQAEIDDDAEIRERLAARERRRQAGANKGLTALAPPDDIVVEQLTSPEWQIVMTLLSAMVNLPVVPPAVRTMAPLGAVDGYAARPQAQARTLVQYLRQKTEGDPVSVRGIVVGRSFPAKEWHPHAPRLRSALRAWANSLDRTEAPNWLDVDRVLRHLDTIEDAGLRIMAIYGRMMDRLGLPVDGVQAGPSFGLPLMANPLPEEDLRTSSALTQT